MNTDDLIAALSNEEINEPWAIIDRYGEWAVQGALNDPLADWHGIEDDSAFRTDLFIECCQGWLGELDGTEHSH